MNRINKIITTQKNGSLKTWSSLKKACHDLGLPYWTLSRKKFPFEYKGYKFTKTQIN